MIILPLGFGKYMSYPYIYICGWEKFFGRGVTFVQHVHIHLKTIFFCADLTNYYVILQ